ncbi:hypothetical protein QTP88_017279 [Uroleucon formosanum]
MFNYEGEENSTVDGETIFRTTFFICIIDQALSSLNLRFNQFQTYNENFGFLYRIGKLKEMEDDDLIKNCKDLHMYLMDGELNDIDSNELYHELQIFKSLVEINTTALQSFSMLKKLNGSFPNITIALRIMLTVPITSATVERSFSKLKLIKNYLMSTIMSQTRLTGLSTLSIEIEISETINSDTLINDFARNILIIDHGHISGNGKPYASKILESPTWLEICKIANDLIITTGTYFFKYLNDICVVHDLENIKICCLGMGVLSYVNKKIEIESPCYYNLDEKLKKFLGFQNRTFDFSLDINTSTMYVPNSNEQYINIEKQCEFRLGRNGQIPLGTIFIGIYSINEIENVFNSFGAIYVANFPKIKFEIINGFLNVTASIGLCFDEYLSNCLGFDYIGNFKKLIPINKTWPRGKEIVLGVEYTEPDIAYTVIGIKKPNLYTNVFLKNFNGVIRSNKVKTLIKGNYSIDQLNSKLPPGIKLQNDKNCITLTSKTDFYMDQNFKLSLGIENMYFLYKHNGDILNNKSLLDVHCNIIEKSFSSISDKCHIEEDLLYNFYYNDDNPYIKTNPIKYIPVNGGFQEIKIDIINQDGKKYDFDDDNFIVYLDLIKE